MAVDNTDNSIHSFKGEKMFGNHMKKTVIAACATVASLSLLLAGCGTDSSSGKTQIRFATWDKAEDVDRQQTLVDQFNESHDDIEVTLEALSQVAKRRFVSPLGIRPKMWTVSRRWWISSTSRMTISRSRLRPYPKWQNADSFRHLG